VSNEQQITTFSLPSEETAASKLATSLHSCSGGEGRIREDVLGEEVAEVGAYVSVPKYVGAYVKYVGAYVKYVGAYVPVPKYVGAFDSSPPCKGWVRLFFGYAVDVGVFVFMSVVSFLGYAVGVGASVEVGAGVSSGKLINSSPPGKGWVRSFFG